MNQDERAEFLKAQQKWHEAEAEKHQVQAEAYRQAWVNLTGMASQERPTAVSK